MPMRIFPLFKSEISELKASLCAGLVSYSNNVGSASNMIPCFPASNGTDARHCDTISNRSSPSHFTKDSPSNISQVRTRSTTKNLCHCLENQKEYYLRNSDKGECSCYSSSQDD
jgi:hypothetical protein